MVKRRRYFTKFNNCKSDSEFDKKERDLAKTKVQLEEQIKEAKDKKEELKQAIK